MCLLDDLSEVTDGDYLTAKMETDIHILNNMRNRLVDMTKICPVKNSISILLTLVFYVHLYGIIRFSETMSLDPGGMRIEDPSTVEFMTASFVRQVCSKLGVSEVHGDSSYQAFPPQSFNEI